MFIRRRESGIVRRWPQPRHVNVRNQTGSSLDMSMSVTRPAADPRLCDWGFNSFKIFPIVRFRIDWLYGESQNLPHLLSTESSSTIAAIKKIWDPIFLMSQSH